MYLAGKFYENEVGGVWSVRIVSLAVAVAMVHILRRSEDDYTISKPTMVKSEGLIEPGQRAHVRVLILGINTQFLIVPF